MTEPEKKDTRNLKNEKKRHTAGPNALYRIAFRDGAQIHSAYSKLTNLAIGDSVMVKSEQGMEPARIFKGAIKLPADYSTNKPPEFLIIRRATNDENTKYDNLIIKEKDAFKLCCERINKLSLKMKLISVERHFNGSKVVFYFTADNRVDFRELVKGLVQEFRTRVEMKQIGVRHETKMIGGLGCCGRELCCSSFIGKFAPVSIKMAKDQDLPLNPAKISGVCNRLLCCLTHEHATYKALRKGMPKYGKNLVLDGKTYKIIKINVLAGTISVVHPGEDGPLTLQREEWQKGVVESRPKKVVATRPKKNVQSPPNSNSNRNKVSKGKEPASRPPRRQSRKNNNPKRSKR